MLSFKDKPEGYRAIYKRWRMANPGRKPNEAEDKVLCDVAYGWSREPETLEKRIETLTDEVVEVCADFDRRISAAEDRLGIPRDVRFANIPIRESGRN